MGEPSVLRRRHRELERRGQRWATCALTRLVFIRLSSNPASVQPVTGRGGSITGRNDSGPLAYLLGGIVASCGGSICHSRTLEPCGTRGCCPNGPDDSIFPTLRRFTPAI